jgi:hypothetical protein
MERLLPFLKLGFRNAVVDGEIGEREADGEPRLEAVDLLLVDAAVRGQVKVLHPDRRRILAAVILWKNKKKIFNFKFPRRRP